MRLLDNAIGPLKFIFTDLDDVLCPSTELINGQEIAALEALRLANPNSRLAKEEIAALQQTYKEARRDLGTNSPKHLDYILRKYGMEHSEKIISAGRVAYHRKTMESWKPYQDVELTLIGAKNKGLDWGIITNGRVEKQWDKLSLMGLMSYFDPVIISEGVKNELGVEEKAIEKPNKAIYSFALDRLREKEGFGSIDPQHTLYIDDRVKNFKGAKALGMKTVWIPNGKYASDVPERVADSMGWSMESFAPDYTLTKFSDLSALIQEKFKVA